MPPDFPHSFFICPGSRTEGSGPQGSFCSSVRWSYCSSPEGSHRLTSAEPSQQGGSQAMAEGTAEAEEPHGGGTPPSSFTSLRNGATVGAKDGVYVWFSGLAAGPSLHESPYPLTPRIQLTWVTHAREHRTHTVLEERDTLLGSAAAFSLPWRNFHICSPGDCLCLPPFQRCAWTHAG